MFPSSSSWTLVLSTLDTQLWSRKCHFPGSPTKPISFRTKKKKEKPNQSNKFNWLIYGFFNQCWVVKFLKVKQLIAYIIHQFLLAVPFLTRLVSLLLQDSFYRSCVQLITHIKGQIPCVHSQNLHVISSTHQLAKEDITENLMGIKILSLLKLSVCSHLASNRPHNWNSNRCSRIFWQFHLMFSYNDGLSWSEDQLRCNNGM